MAARIGGVLVAVDEVVPSEDCSREVRVPGIDPESTTAMTILSDPFVTSQAAWRLIAA